jgi:hypothetical protein
MYQACKQEQQQGHIPLATGTFGTARALRSHSVLASQQLTHLPYTSCTNKSHSSSYKTVHVTDGCLSHLHGVVGTDINVLATVHKHVTARHQLTAVT